MLWNNVTLQPGMSEEIKNAWIARSAPSSLEMTIRDGWYTQSTSDWYSNYDDPEFSESLLLIIFETLSRTKSLDLSMSHELFMTLQWPDSVPSLERLSMLVVDIDPTVSPNIYETFSRNLPTLFPSLKYYHADGFTFDFMHWTLPPTLTELHLFGKGPFATHGLNHVTDTLRQLPRLESLVLNNAIPHDSPHTNFTSLPQVMLPCLRYLHLSGPLEVQVVMLDIIKPGPSVRLALNLVIPHDNFEQARLLFRPSFTSWLRKIIPPVNVAIVVEDGARSHSSHDTCDRGGCDVSFAAWSTPQSLETLEKAPRGPCYPCDTLLHMQFVLHDNTVKLSPSSTRNLFSPLERLLSSFPLSDVSTLVLSCTQGPVFNIPRVYHKMAALRALYIYGKTSFYLVLSRREALREILRQFDLAEDIGKHTVVFPQLATLTLSGIQFHDAHESFLDALRRRKILQESRESLSDALQVRLLGCDNLDSSYIKKLGHVASIKWDGVAALE